ncbi:MspA family porin [Nocardia sp. NPDC005366]|uniref:MspA family porin n=1 Tax=Nocardia sp. NPDC005366 TaxID=3156878 RepID=UPI00339E3672
MTASALAVLPASAAHADIATLPPHEKTFSSMFGSFTVGVRDEAIQRIAPLNMIGTTQEALVSNVAYGRVDGPAGGVLKTGYAVGCAVKIDSGSVGAEPTLEAGVEGPQQNYATEQAQSRTTEQSQSRTTEQSSTGESVQSQTRQSGQAQTQESGQVQERQGVKPHVTVDPGPILALNLKPGDVQDIAIGEGKELIPGKTVQIVTRDYHIKVDDCLGPVTIRQFTYLYARSPEVDDSGAVFGDPTSL